MVTNLNCDSFPAHGDLVSTLKKIIKVQKPDLMVMGTKGASGLKKILIGSNTVNVISKTKVPVLVIPEVARFKNFLKKGKNRIVLATDLDLLENEDALDILKEIALLIIEPKLRVLSVRSKNARLWARKKGSVNFFFPFSIPILKANALPSSAIAVIGWN